MIELQLLTGMRSGELVLMRSRDLNTSGRVWEYRPASHKTAYRGHERIIYIGPQAQEVLRPWLRTNLEEYLFQPAEVEAWRRAQLTAQRKTPASCGNRVGTNRKESPREFQPHYDTRGYGQAVQYALDKLNRHRAKQGEEPIHWHPHQLRHLAATRL
jgi:integrase